MLAGYSAWEKVSHGIWISLWWHQFWVLPVHGEWRDILEGLQWLRRGEYGWKRGGRLTQGPWASGKLFLKKLSSQTWQSEKYITPLTQNSPRPPTQRGMHWAEDQVVSELSVSKLLVSLTQKDQGLVQVSISSAQKYAPFFFSNLEAVPEVWFLNIVVSSPLPT